MSGHSKWATTKHKKAAIDAKRSSLFSKLSRNITVAAKLGGDPNPDNNATLAAAVARARMVSMPNAKIKAAIDKAFGSGADAANYAEITYEGYGPAGVAVYVDCLTDNKNRTAADVRSAFSHSGGSLGTSGSVAFQFERKGSIAVDKIIKSEDKKVADKENAVDEDEFMMAVAEAGGEDYEDAGEEWIVWTAYDKMQDVQKGLEAQGIEVKGSELTMVPTTPTAVSAARSTFSGTMELCATSSGLPARFTSATCARARTVKCRTGRSPSARTEISFLVIFMIKVCVPPCFLCKSLAICPHLC